MSLSIGSDSYGYVAYYADKVINAPNGTIEGDYFWSIIDGVNTLCGYIGNGGDIVLPTDYKGENYAIGDYAFYKCTGLTSVTIPNSVTSIGYRAFWDCDGLTSIEIPNSVTTVGDYAFRGCTGLTSITIPNSVTTIGDDAFRWCTGLTSVEFNAENCTRMGSRIDPVFVSCTALTTLKIGDNVKNIPNYAFEGCDITKTIWLTKTPPTGYSNAQGKINYVANDQYSSLSNVVVYPYLSLLFEVDGIKYVPVSPAERTCDVIDFTYDTAIETLNIGETVMYKNVAMNVKEVMPYTCYENKNIKNLTISNEGSIGEKAFHGCTGLKNIEICNNGDIGTSAFEGCTGLSDIKISNKGNIGTSAFEGCTGLKNIEIGNNGDIGISAFKGCIGLSDIIISNNGNIGTSAFEDCTGLNNIEISNKGDIGASAFKGCTGLSNIKICNNGKIGDSAFSGCSAVPEIVIPQAVAEIGNYAFSGCSSLADVIIEDREVALSLGSNGSSPLFADCPLDSVYIGGKISYETSKSYGYSPFYRNASLRSVVITDTEEKIYDNEFYGCTGLKNVQIGNGVKSIGKWAFSGCSNLDYLIVGANVSTIGQEAFSDCSNVTTIYAHAMVPPVCGAQALEDINKWNCTLMVPNESIAAYQAAEQWKDFFFISDIPTGIENIPVDGIDALNNDVIFDLNGRRVTTPAKGGIYIVNGKKVVL